MKTLNNGKTVMARKPRWQHYHKERSYNEGSLAICGKKYIGWRKTDFVHELSKTTCPRCLALLVET